MRISDWSSDVCSSDLTEDYYVANKLMKGFIGTANIDTNSRLCMSSAVAGHMRAFGEDVVPATYDDLDAADLFVLVGSNTAWCHPIVYQRIRARCEAGAKLIVRSEEHTSELQSLMRISYAVFCLKKKRNKRIMTI